MIKLRLPMFMHSDCWIYQIINDHLSCITFLVIPSFETFHFEISFIHINDLK